MCFLACFLLLMLIFDASWFLKFKNLHEWHNTPWFSSLFARRKCSDPPQKIPTDTTIPRRRMCSGIPYHPTVAATNKYLLFFVWRSKVYSWQTKLGSGFKYFFYFHPYLRKIRILTNIFQMGWNHQPENGGQQSDWAADCAGNPPVKLSRNRRKPWTKNKPCTSILYWHPYRYIWSQHSWYWTIALSFYIFGDYPSINCVSLHLQLGPSAPKWWLNTHLFRIAWTPWVPKSWDFS